MKSALLVGLSVLVCQILAQVNIPAVQDFDPQKFAGPWYLIVMVMDNVVHEEAGNVNVTATPIGSRDVLLTMVIYKDDVCYLEKVHLIQTQQPGVFNISGCDIIVRMVEVDYDKYFLLHFTTMNNRILHLYTRRKKQIRQHTKHFRRVARLLKFDLNKIIFGSRNIKCRNVLEKNPYSYS